MWKYLDGTRTDAFNDKNKITSETFSDFLTSEKKRNKTFSGWRYATQRSYSLVADLDLGCRNVTHLVQVSNAVFMTGFGAGGLAHGLVADAFGRKVVLVYSSLLLPVVGFASAAYANEVWNEKFLALMKKNFS